MRLILASSSERRAELFSWLGIPFEVLVSDVDESSIEERRPDVLVKRLALAKAQAVAEKVQSLPRVSTTLVIGADTVVEVDGEVIGKPRDASDAVRILRKLSGKTHAVYTGVAVVDVASGRSQVASERTAVTFRKLSDQEIEGYVATGEPLDKGGGYAIQMGASGFVAKVEGSFTNVVGLPLVKLQALMEKSGYPIEKDVSRIVFEKTGYQS